MESNLEVWKLSHQLTIDVYKLTQVFPKSEQFGLVSQVRRSVSSIPTNIIEGQARQYKKEFIQFLGYAKGSAGEMTTQIIIANRLGYVNDKTAQS